MKNRNFLRWFCLALLLLGGCEPASQKLYAAPPMRPVPLQPKTWSKSKVIPNKLTAARALNIARAAVSRREIGPEHLVCKLDEPHLDHEINGGIWWVLIHVSHVDHQGRLTVPASANYGDDNRLIGVNGRGKVVYYSSSD